MKTVNYDVTTHTAVGSIEEKIHGAMIVETVSIEVPDFEFAHQGENFAREFLRKNYRKASYAQKVMNPEYQREPTFTL